MASYVPANTVSTACHDITITNKDMLETVLSTPLKIAAVVPPRPYERLCGCMIDSLACLAKPDFLAANQSPMNMTVCTENNAWCQGVSANGTTGVYGAFSTCNSTEQASWIMNQYYDSHAKSPESCSSLNGILRSKKVPETKECKSLLSQVGPDGMGAITATPTPDSKLGDQNGSSFTVGVKVALGVCIAALAAFIALLILFFRLRRKKQQIADQETTKVESHSPAPFKSEPEATLSESGTTYGELDGEQRTELPAADTKVEELPVDGAEVMELCGLSNLDRFKAGDLYELPGDLHVAELEDRSAISPFQPGTSPIGATPVSMLESSEVGNIPSSIESGVEPASSTALRYNPAAIQSNREQSREDEKGYSPTDFRRENDALDPVPPYSPGELR